MKQGVMCVRSVRSHGTKALAAACALGAVAWGVAAATTTSAAAAASPWAGLAGIHVRPDVQVFPTGSNLDLSLAACQASWNVNCYNPQQLEQAYNLNGLYSKHITGKGTTIVLIDAYGSPTIDDDLAEFDGQEGLPNPSFRVIQPVGKVGAFDMDNGDMLSWANESTIDVDYSHAIAPGANIVLLETPNDDPGTLANAVKYAVSHHLGNVISQSFGLPEQYLGASAVKAWDSIYRQAAAEHITVLASTGDDGASGINFSNGTYYNHAVVQWPASDPYVTALGGTSLNLSQNGTRLSPDVVWNDSNNTAVNDLLYGDDGPNPDGTGGGKSVVFSRPSYQNGVKSVTGGSRGVPDIAMSGACDGTVQVYGSYEGFEGWYAVCGTSEAAPLFAGIVALADQVAGHPLGFINPAIYKLYAEHAKGIVPVKSGNNTVDIQGVGTVRGYSARNGYSLVAGVGTVNGLLFVPELASAG
jgi:subtilase family serine protease